MKAFLLTCFLVVASVYAKGEDDERNAEEAIRNLDLGEELIDNDVASVELDVNLNQAMPDIPKIDLPKINLPKTKLDLGIDLNGEGSDESLEDDDEEEVDDGDDDADGDQGAVDSPHLAEEAKKKMQIFLNKKLRSMKDLIENKLNMLQHEYFERR